MKNSKAKRIFGTDGIRGIANEYPITVEVALNLGKAIALLFREKKSKKIVIGKDTRKSNYMLENAIAAGICSMGVNTIFLGPIPTPGLAFITQSMRADAGVMISASHNPFYDNGIKLFDASGYKLPDDVEHKISDMIEQQNFGLGPTREHIGTAFRIEEAGGRYITYLKSTLANNVKLDGLKIAVDCAHGASYKIAPVIFEELGATVSAIGIKPNGTNINDSCGALHPDLLSQLVKSENANIGVALDGDADRVVLIDEKGNIVDGDAILGLCAVHLKSKGQLKGDTVVATVMSNMGLESFLQKQGIALARTQVGDRYVTELMRSQNYCLGGEQSGHVVFSDYSTTGDGILCALRVLEIMYETGKSLSELVKAIPKFPQLLSKITVKDKKDWQSIPSCLQLVSEVEKDLKDKGRVLLRYSGTEPVFRIMIEGEDEHKIKTHLSRLQDEFSKQLGTVTR